MKTIELYGGPDDGRIITNIEDASVGISRIIRVEAEDSPDACARHEKHYYRADTELRPNTVQLYKYTGFTLTHFYL